MNPKYFGNAGWDVQVIEECSEVIKAICKIQRFGITNYCPEKPESDNFKDLINEINDLELAIKEYVQELTDKQYYMNKSLPVMGEKDIVNSKHTVSRNEHGELQINFNRESEAIENIGSSEE